MNHLLEAQGRHVALTSEAGIDAPCDSLCQEHPLQLLAHLGYAEQG